MRNDFSSSDDQEFIKKLRFQLFSKFSDEWTEKWKPKKHGNTFEGIEKLKSKNAFYEDLQQDIYATVAMKLGKNILQDYIISKDSILRFLNEKYQFGFKESTLDIFSIYCGYENWSYFKAKSPIEIKPIQQPVVNVYALISTRQQLERIEKTDFYEIPQRRKNYQKLLFSLLFLSTIAFGSYYYWFKYLPFREIMADEIKTIKFQVSKKNNEYNPSKVTFDYDFSQLKLDSLRAYFDGNRGVMEQQSEILRTPKGKFAFDFYKPGLHNVMLYHQSQLLNTYSVFLKSHGWACWYVTPDWTNTNFAYKDFYANEMAFLHPDKIKNTLHRNNYLVNIIFADEFKVDLDSTYLEYDIKHSPDEFAISCYDHHIILGTENGNSLNIGFGRDGCHEFTLKNAMPFYYDKGVPLYRLFFPKIFYEWSKVKIEFKNHHVKVWVNNELLTDSPYEIKNAPLREIHFESKGSAMYDNVRLSNSYTNKVIFFDDFNKTPISKDGY